MLGAVVVGVGVGVVIGMRKSCINGRSVSAVVEPMIEIKLSLDNSIKYPVILKLGMTCEK